MRSEAVTYACAVPKMLGTTSRRGTLSKDVVLRIAASTHFFEPSKSSGRMYGKSDPGGWLVFRLEIEGDVTSDPWPAAAGDSDGRFVPGFGGTSWSQTKRRTGRQVIYLAP